MHGVVRFALAAALAAPCFGVFCLVAFAPAAALAQNYTPGSCLCIFDYEDTLVLRSGMPGARVANAVTRCIDDQYKIAVVADGCDSEFIKRLLTERINSTIFFGQLLSSPAFQYCEANRTATLDRITTQLGVQPKCAALLDNSAANRQYAQQAGVVFENVDGDQGVRPRDVKNAEDKFSQNNCLCQPPTGGVGR